MNEHWRIEQVLDSEKDYISVLVGGVEIARGTPEQMMIVERELRLAADRIVALLDGSQ